MTRPRGAPPAGQTYPDAALDDVGVVGLRSEELGRAEEPARQALLVGVAQERAENRDVGAEAVGPEILPHDAAGALYLVVQPGEHAEAGRGLGDPPRGRAPGLLER